MTFSQTFPVHINGIFLNFILSLFCVASIYKRDDFEPFYNCIILKYFFFKNEATICVIFLKLF